MKYSSMERWNTYSHSMNNFTSDLSQIMAKSRDWNELKWAWDGWRNASGRNMPDLYEELVSLQNQAAVNGKWWFYKIPQFEGYV